MVKFSALAFYYIILCLFPLWELLGHTQEKTFLSAYMHGYEGVNFLNFSSFLFFETAVMLLISFHRFLFSLSLIYPSLTLIGV